MSEPRCACPICGSEIQVPLDVAYHAETGTLVSSTYSIEFSKRESMVFELLWKHRTRGPVSKDRVHFHLYGDDPNGGPLDKIIEVWICRIRKKLFDANANIDIRTSYERGYSLTSAPARRPFAKQRKAA